MRLIDTGNGWQIQVRWHRRWRAIVRYGANERNWFFGVRGLFDIVGNVDGLSEDAFMAGANAQRVLSGR